jgi:BirA family transcriptional regulator, biotin operon repressor / biotin---[acetyl-CoA-carboxylase] ligase
LDVSQVESALSGREIHYFPSLGSTMTEAAKLVRAGAPHGTLVVADEQTAGVGRFGRTWHSEADTGIYATFVLRLEIGLESVSPVTLALGLAAADAIQSTTDLVCDLRWPNDVLIGDYKVAGILTQLIDPAVIVGIGINVNQSQLRDDMRTPATSLRLAADGRVFSRERILVALARSIDRLCAILVNEGTPAILRAFGAASSYVVNRRVVFETQTGFDRGHTAGLDEQGFLLVRRESGDVVTVITGGIRPDLGSGI